MQDDEKKYVGKVKYNINGCTCNQALCPHNYSSQHKETAQGLHKPNFREKKFAGNRQTLSKEEHEWEGKLAWSNQGN